MTPPPWFTGFSPVIPIPPRMKSSRFALACLIASPAIVASPSFGGTAAKVEAAVASETPSAGAWFAFSGGDESPREGGLHWRAAGHRSGRRNLGQTFTPAKPATLSRIVLTIQSGVTRAEAKATAGAPFTLQIFEFTTVGDNPAVRNTVGRFQGKLPESPLRAGDKLVFAFPGIPLFPGRPYGFLLSFDDPASPAVVTCRIHSLSAQPGGQGPLPGERLLLQTEGRPLGSSRWETLDFTLGDGAPSR